MNYLKNLSKDFKIQLSICLLIEENENNDDNDPVFTLTVASFINMGKDLLELLDTNDNFKTQALVNFAGLVELTQGLSSAIYKVIPRINTNFSVPPPPLRQRQTLPNQWAVFTEDLMSDRPLNTGGPTIPAAPSAPMFTDQRTSDQHTSAPNTGATQQNPDPDQ